MFSFSDYSFWYYYGCDYRLLKASRCTRCSTTLNGSIDCLATTILQYYPQNSKSLASMFSVLFPFNSTIANLCLYVLILPFLISSYRMFGLVRRENQIISILMVKSEKIDLLLWSEFSMCLGIYINMLVLDLMWLVVKLPSIDLFWGSQYNTKPKTCKYSHIRWLI